MRAKQSTLQYNIAVYSRQTGLRAEKPNTARLLYTPYPQLLQSWGQITQKNKAISSCVENSDCLRGCKNHQQVAQGTTEPGNSLQPLTSRQPLTHTTSHRPIPQCGRAWTEQGHTVDKLFTF